MTAPIPGDTPQTPSLMSEPGKFCPGCGTATSGAAFCSECGAATSPMSREPAGTAPPQAPVYAAQKTNGFAVASMVLGILWLYWIGSLLALIFGYKARAQIDASGGSQGGRGMAVAGIVLGWIGIGVVGLGFLAVVAISVLGEQADDEFRRVGDSLGAAVVSEVVAADEAYELVG